MDIRAAEISAILKDQIKNFGQEAEVTEVGQVLSVGLEQREILQRISIHPDHDVEALTLRCWEATFGDDPLRSDLYLATA